mmetsp:Transcript_3351/g.7921  ORF Transcript_3351/g.7921 Transcript_3351/m.7921 type:complete len:297 (+) Transcript_3351:243-1133(+)
MSFLNDLPSKGFFKNSTEKAVTKPECEAPLYLAYHDQKAPEPQMVVTDTTNILIRSLLLRRQKQDVHETGAQFSSAGHGSDRPERHSKSSSGKKRPQEAELPQTDSRKRAHIPMPSTPGESAGCPTTGGASGAGYSVAMPGIASRSDACEGSASANKAMEIATDRAGADEANGMVDAQDEDWADSSMEELTPGAAAPHLALASSCSKASTDDQEDEDASEQEEEEEDDIFRSREEKERIEGGSGAKPHASADSPQSDSDGLHAQKIAALRERCKQMGLPSQGKKDALVTRILASSQ